MKTELIIIMILLAGFCKITLAQQPNKAGPADTLVVVWSSIYFHSINYLYKFAKNCSEPIYSINNVLTASVLGLKR